MRATIRGVLLIVTKVVGRPQVRFAFVALRRRKLCKRPA